MQSLNVNSSSSSIIEGCGILGDYPASFDHTQRPSVAPLQRTRHPLKFAEMRSRQAVLPFTSRQNVSLDYTTEADYRTVAVPPASDRRSWSNGYSYDAVRVPNQDDDDEEYYDGWEESREDSVNTWRMNNGADNQRLGRVNRFVEACHPLPPLPPLPPPPPPSTSLHSLPFHPPQQQHPYLRSLPPSRHPRHQPGLDDVYQVSMICRKVEEPFGTRHLQEVTRRELAKKRRPFLPEAHRPESRHPSGSCFEPECIEENVEISLKKTRRVLLPTPIDCSARDPSPLTLSRAASAPTGGVGGGGRGEGGACRTNASTTAMHDDTDAEARPGDQMRVLRPSPSATHSSRPPPPPHHPIIRSDVRTVLPTRLPPFASSSPLPPPPPPPPPPSPTQQQQHRKVMRTTSLDEPASRSTGSRGAKGFSIGCASSSISGGDDRQKDSYICQICRVRCNSLENFDVHMQSDEHRQLMKAIASVHLQKTKQKLKTLKVNRKQRLKFTNNANRRNHRVGLRPSWLTSPVTTTATAPPTTKDGFKCKTTTHNTHGEKMNGTQRPGRGEKPAAGSCLPNKAKFLLECTLHRQTEADVHPIWLASSSDGGGGGGKDAKPNASQPKGQECIVSVSGFLCKLCDKFYNDETTAKVTHCSSRKHICKYREMLKMVKTFRENSAVDNTKL